MRTTRSTRWSAAWKARASSWFWKASWTGNRPSAGHDSFGSQALQRSVGTGHARLAHGSAGGPPVDYFIQDAGSQLAHVHLQDADGHADRHWAIGEGNIFRPSVFRAIAALDQSPRLLLNLRDNGQIAQSMMFLAERELAR